MNLVLKACLVLALSIPVLTSCTKKETTEAQEEKSSGIFDQARKSIDKAEEAVNNLSEGSGEVVDYNKLKDWLPKKVNGLKQVSSEGESNSGFGFNASQATGVYGEGEEKVVVEVIDFGGLQAVISAMASWSEIKRDAESDEGYEKTKTIEGMKAFVQYKYKPRRGDINLLSDTYIINIRTVGIEQKDFENITDDLNFRKLNKLKPKQ